MSHDQALIITAVAVVVLAAVAGSRRIGIPTSVVLVIAGLAIGFAPFVPDVALDPDVALLGLLPLLVYHAAGTTSPRALLRDAPTIGVLAVVLVILTAGGVALVAHEVGHLPWATAFILGTAVGPTDAAAATSVARRLGLPGRLLTILEGEALFNDATALVLYGAAVTAATTGRFSVAHTAGAVAYAVVVGAGIGLAVGVAGRWVRRLIDDAPVEIVASMLLAYAAYLPAEAAGASGVLATVTAGLYLGWHSSAGGAFSAHSRLQSTAFWDILVFLIEAALFVMVGLSFHTFRAGAGGPLGRAVITGAAVVGTIVVLRLALQAVLAIPLPGRRHPTRPGERAMRVVVGWSGMRGAITLAALLAVPTMTSSGHALAGRDDIIYDGFAVIVVTLVGQGLTLPALVRRLHLREQASAADVEVGARLALTRAAVDHLTGVLDRAGAPEDVTEGLRAQYQARLQRLEATGGSADEEGATPVTAAELRREVIERQRAVLLQLRDDGHIGLDLLRRLERELDLEEVRLPG